MRWFSPRLSDQGRAWLGHAWQRARRPLLRGGAAFGVLLTLYAAWPYVALWRLHLAVMHDDRAALEAAVRLDAVRDELDRRLNKDRESVIGELSDPFIAWLESGIREYGVQALDRRVTLDWIRDQLVPATAPGLGFVSAVSYCFFDGPRSFLVRMDRGDGTPVTLRLQLGASGWRVVAVYY